MKYNEPVYVQILINHISDLIKVVVNGPKMAVKINRNTNKHSRGTALVCSYKKLLSPRSVSAW